MERLVAESKRRAIHADELWLSMLHISEGKRHIADQRYFLGGAPFSPDHELTASIELLWGPDAASARCRFPARYLWISARLDLPAEPLKHCTGLQEFITRAPADTIWLVHASENLAQPSSMMGHVLIKLAGNGTTGQHVEHSVSFFTDATTWNLPKLFYDSMVIGKKGYFALSPYREQLDYYARVEGRNIIEYRIDLSEFQRTLIQAHLFELKDTQLTYFFDDYNCATLVNFVLSLAAPQIREPGAFWVTPLDVVKNIEEAGIVAERNVIPSSRWTIRTLNQQLPASVREAAKKAVDARALPDQPTSVRRDERYLALELSAAYNRYLWEQGRISESEWLDYAQKTDRTRSVHYGDLSLDASQYKNPRLTPQDSQIFIGPLRRGDRNFLRIGVLPASHRLEDDNRQYFSESELKLFELQLLASTTNPVIRLDTLNVYSVQSLIPRDPLTGGLSGRFRIALEPHFGSEIRRHRAMSVNGALGLTQSLDRDVEIYALLGGGVAWAQERLYAHGNPEIGLIVRQVFDMKSVLSLARHYNELGTGHSYNVFRITHALPLGRQHALTASYVRRFEAGRHDTEFEMLYKKYF